jgi:stage V sporulation protein R
MRKKKFGKYFTDSSRNNRKLHKGENMGTVKQATKPLNAGPNWRFQDLEEYMSVIGEIAETEFGISTYPNQIEIISSEQMIDAYTFSGLPICYHHWRYGKAFSMLQSEYLKGNKALAYELVINSKPCISYFLEENNMVTQALVAAHACIGHNAFFKENFLFKEWTQPDSIIDYMIFARDFIKKCEEKYGYEKVEETLDAAHAIEKHGVDKYKRPSPLSAVEERKLQEKRIEEGYKSVYELWNTLNVDTRQKEAKEKKFPEQPEENLLYFLEKNSPILETWQREILRIVRKVAQYFYPQDQTKVMNEGYATYWHYKILYRMWDLGYVTDGFMQSFLSLHTNVVNQPDYNKGGICLGGLNPYYLGFNIFRDIERVCTTPTEEDKKWFPASLLSEHWLDAVKYAGYNFKDEGFVLQYLSPHLIRKMRLFALEDDSGKDHYDVIAISNEDGYKKIRSLLSQAYNRAYCVPDIQVTEADIKGDRRLTLQHYSVNSVPLEEKDKVKVGTHIKKLWGFDVQIFSDARPKKGFSEEDYYVWI